MTMIYEWLVDGPRGQIWIVATTGDNACQKYRGKFGLAMWQVDRMSVIDVRTRKSFTSDGTKYMRP